MGGMARQRLGDRWNIAKLRRALEIGTDVVRCAWTILDHEELPETFLHPLCNDLRKGVGTATRPEWDDVPDRPRRLGLCLGQRNESGAGEYQHPEPLEAKQVHRPVP